MPGGRGGQYGSAPLGPSDGKMRAFWVCEICGSAQKPPVPASAKQPVQGQGGIQEGGAWSAPTQGTVVGSTEPAGK
jgi:hypothetical protein